MSLILSQESAFLFTDFRQLKLNIWVQDRHFPNFWWWVETSTIHCVCLEGLDAWRLGEISLWWCHRGPGWVRTWELKSMIGTSWIGKEVRKVLESLYISFWRKHPVILYCVQYLTFLKLSFFYNNSSYYILIDANPRLRNIQKGNTY